MVGSFYNDAYYVWNNEWQQLALLNDDFSSVNSLAISGDLRPSNVLIDDSVSSILLIDSTEHSSTIKRYVIFNY